MVAKQTFEPFRQNSVGGGNCFVDWDNDGKLELLLLRYPKNLWELSRIVASLQNQKYDDPLVTFVSAERFHLTMGEETPWTLDGEFGGAYTEADVEVCPSAVRWMLGKPHVTEALSSDPA